MTIDLGDVVTLEFPVLTAQSYVNASAVTLTVTLPDGTAVTPTVANPPAETGRYRCDYPTVQAGRHLVRWTSTTPTSAYTDQFDVRPANPPLMVSLADVKAHLGKSAANVEDDEELRSFVEAATALVEDIRGEVVARRTVVDDINVPGGTGALLLPHSPVISLTSVASVDGATSWDVADLYVDSRTGVVAVQAGSSLSGMVRFTYVAGYVVVPANYSLAAKIIAAHLWETQQQPALGPRGPFGTDGPDVMVMPGAGYAVPNRALQLLGGRRPLVA